MRSAESLRSKTDRVYRFICVFLLGAFVAMLQTSSIHAQSPASAGIRDELAKPLDIADSSANSVATVEKESQIGVQSETLLKVALDLQKEVNRTTETTISAAALRKADQIEKLVKEITAVGHESANR